MKHFTQEYAPKDGRVGIRLQRHFRLGNISGCFPSRGKEKYLDLHPVTASHDQMDTLQQPKAKASKCGQCDALSKI